MGERLGLPSPAEASVSAQTPLHTIGSLDLRALCAPTDLECLFPILSPPLRSRGCAGLWFIFPLGVRALKPKPALGTGGADCLRLGVAQQVAFFLATGGRRLVPKAPFLPTEHEEELLTFLHVCQLKPQM